jgi:antitoxin ParD1/3/4
MNISLTHELESLVQEKVRSGLYHSASEVIREALRLLQDQEDLKRVRLEALRKEIAVGVAQADSGQTKTLDMKAIKTKARISRKGPR